MTERNCGTCKHFRTYNQEEEVEYGECHANPPQVVTLAIPNDDAEDGSMIDIVDSYWPPVPAEESCGQHALDLTGKNGNECQVDAKE